MVACAYLIALVALIAMEIVLGIDNLVFVAILSSRLPAAQAAKARRIGIGLSLIFRVLLVAGAAYVVHLTTPLFTILGEEFSWRDLILIAGGLFLVFKATTEIHHNVEPDEDALAAPRTAKAFAAIVGQIVLPRAPAVISFSEPSWLGIGLPPALLT